MTAKPNAHLESEAALKGPAAPRPKKKRVVRQPRLAWSVRRIHPAIRLLGLYGIALGLARTVVVLSPGPSEVPRDGYTWTALIAAAAAAAWLGALAVYAAWLARRFASAGLRPWRMALIAWVVTACALAWLLIARAGFVNRLAFRTIQHVLPFYASAPSLHLTALAGVFALVSTWASRRRGR
ncbi:MAG: hypothetical protein ACYC9Q_12350 [Bacillota bacterium]